MSNGVNLEAETRVSVIVPCFNEAVFIDNFIENIFKQDLRGIHLQVIVADGMSTDSTPEKLRTLGERFPTLAVIQNPQRIVSTGLNAAIAMATGTYLVRMDVHTEYADDYIFQCVECLRSTGAACVGGAWRAVGRTQKQQVIAAAFQSSFGSGGAPSRRPEYSGEVDTVYLGAWERSTLINSGGFDPDLVRNQDDELCLRLRRSGGKIWQSASIRSTYFVRDSFAKLFKQFYQYGYWKVLVIKKHKMPASVRHVAPGLFFGGLGASVVASLFFPVLSVIPILLAGTYIAFSVWFSISGPKSAVTLSGVMMSIVAFAMMHAGYGFGFLRGLWDFGARGIQKSSALPDSTR